MAKRKPTLAQVRKATREIKAGPKIGWGRILSAIGWWDETLRASLNEALDGLTGRTISTDDLDMSEAELGDLIDMIDSQISDLSFAKKHIEAFLNMVEDRGTIIRRREAAEEGA